MRAELFNRSLVLFANAMLGIFAAALPVAAQVATDTARSPDWRPRHDASQLVVAGFHEVRVCQF